MENDLRTLVEQMNQLKHTIDAMALVLVKIKNKIDEEERLKKIEEMRLTSISK